MTMDDVGRPVELFHRLDNASGEKDTTVIVVGTEHAFLVIHHVLPFRKEIIVVDEVDLHPGFLDGGHLDDEGVVGIVDDKVHARQADYLMELVAALVDNTIMRHEDPNFLTIFLSGLGQIPAHKTHRSLWQIRGDFLVNEKYSIFISHSSDRMCFKRAKLRNFSEITRNFFQFIKNQHLELLFNVPIYSLSLQGQIDD